MCSFLPVSHTVILPVVLISYLTDLCLTRARGGCIQEEKQILFLEQDTLIVF